MCEDVPFMKYIQCTMDNNRGLFCVCDYLICGQCSFSVIIMEKLYILRVVGIKLFWTKLVITSQGYLKTDIIMRLQ